MRTAWSVIENSPGCLPESEPSTFDTAEKARDYWCALIRELEEQGWVVTVAAWTENSGHALLRDPESISGRDRIVAAFPFITNEEV